MIAQFCDVSQIRFYLTFSKSGPMCYCSNNQKKGIKSPLTIAWHTMEKQSTSSASQYTWHSISWHSELIFQCLQPGFLFTVAQHEKDLLDELEWVLHRVGLVETQCTCKSKQKAHSFWQVFNVVHHDFSFNDDLQWGWTEMEGRWRHSTFTLNKQDPDVPGDRGACLSELLQHFQTKQYLGMLCSCTCSLPIFQGFHPLGLVILSGEKQQICLPQSILYINRNIWDIIFLATVSVAPEMSVRGSLFLLYWLCHLRLHHMLRSILNQVQGWLSLLVSLEKGSPSFMKLRATSWVLSHTKGCQFDTLFWNNTC